MNSFRRLGLALRVLILACTAGTAIAGVKSQLWVTDGTVYAILETNGMIYLGGEFQHVGPNFSGGAASLDATTAVMDPAFPNINGIVKVILQDGAGGWYIGGSFTSAGAESIANLVHVLGDGTVDRNFRPGPTSTVFALARAGNVLYCGGAFTSPRSFLCAVDATTGSLLSWNPGATRPVYAITVAGLVYVGGSFHTGVLPGNTIGGQPRDYAAALDPVTGLATAWNPQPDGEVEAIRVAGSNILLAGLFSRIGAQQRGYFAVVDSVSGAPLTNITAGANAPVRALQVSNDVVYVGGVFTSFGGLMRHGLAALDLNNGSVTGWDAHAEGFTEIYALALTEGTLLAGGSLTLLAGQPRTGVAALDLPTGALTDWNPNVLGVVTGLDAQSNRVCAGGELYGVNAADRKRLAALDATTGRVLPWDPQANDWVFAIAAGTDAIYVGGHFTNIGGVYRSTIAAVDPITGQPKEWAPNTTGLYRHVETIVVGSNAVYAGGAFEGIGGRSQSFLAALDPVTAEVTPWNPNVDGEVRTSMLAGDRLYIGGAFFNAGGQFRRHVAALDTTTGSATPFNPDADDVVWSVFVHGNTVFVGGFFLNIHGVERRYIAAVDAITGVPTAWNPIFENRVYRVVAVGNTLYAAGNFISVNSQFRRSLVAMDALTGTVFPWAPNPSRLNDLAVLALAITRDTVYVGGRFELLEGRRQPNFAGIDLRTTLQPILPGSPNRIQLNVNGAAGHRYVIEGSSNFVQWTPQMTNYAPFIFQDTRNANRKYYRAAW